MKIKELISQLKSYADHKEYCSITNALSVNLTDKEPRRYPECSCGWSDISEKIDEVIASIE